MHLARLGCRHSGSNDHRGVEVIIIRRVSRTHVRLLASCIETNVKHDSRRTNIDITIIIVLY